MTTAKRFAAAVFLVTLAVFTTAGVNYNHDPAGSTEFWSQMVLTIGLGATLSLINAGVTWWLIRYVMSTTLADKKQLMALVMDLQNEKTAQRLAFLRALQRVAPHLGHEDIFDRELGENHRAHGEERPDEKHGQGDGGADGGHGGGFGRVRDPGR